MATRVSRAATAENKRGGDHKRRNHSAQPFLVHCDAFGIHGEIPDTFTASGGNRSPAIRWSEPPSGTEELVLLCEDLDVGGDGFVHWLVYRIPDSVSALPEGVPTKDEIESIQGGPLQGRNSAGTVGYEGPNPPLFDDWHHYRFRLYALGKAIKDLRPGMTRDEIFEKIKDDILDEAETVGRYRRKTAA